MAYTEKVKQLTGFIKKAGDVMTGFLTLHADPTANMHAATKQYVDNKTGMDLLWTNASPTSSFTLQDISLNLSGYKKLLIVYNLSVNTQSSAHNVFRNEEIFIKIGSKFITNGYIVVSASTTILASRSIEFKSSTKIAIGSGGYHGNGTDNQIMVPLYIYGIK